MNLRSHIRYYGFFLVAALMLVCQPAWAEKRVALVIGNSNYKNAAMLPNPANDAAAIAATLKGAGFDVVDSRLDLQSADMRKALREFADQARDADIAVVYYAGHGIEIDGTNYLIPTDARLERDTDIYDEAFSLDRVLLAIEPARQPDGLGGAAGGRLRGGARYRGRRRAVPAAEYLDPPTRNRSRIVNAKPSYALSVVIPSYNRRELLRRCLDSLAVQTHDAADFEVVVVDDGSTDGTAEMVEGLNTPYALRLVRGKQQRWARARNAGVEAAEGRVCLHVDDDIVCSPRMVADHVAAHRDGDRWSASASWSRRHPTPRTGTPTPSPGASTSTTKSSTSGLPVGPTATAPTSRPPARSISRSVVSTPACRPRSTSSSAIASVRPAAPCATCPTPRAPTTTRSSLTACSRTPASPGMLTSRPSPSIPRRGRCCSTGVGPAGPKELALRRALIAIRVPPKPLAAMGSLLPGTGRKMIWLHFVRRFAFWRSVRSHVDRSFWRELTVEDVRRGRDPALPPSVP